MIRNSLVGLEMPDSLEAEGKGLSVLITSAYTHHYDWMAYSCWQSVYINLPHAKTALVVPRNKDFKSLFYRWVFRCIDLRFFLHKNVSEQISYLNKIYGVYVALKRQLVKTPLLVLEADMVVTSDFLPQTVKSLKEVEFATNPDHSVWYFGKDPLEKIARSINMLGSLTEPRDVQALKKVFGDPLVLEDLGSDVSSQTVTTVVQYKEKCGNFDKKDWSKKGSVPPFNTAYALYSYDMSANEKNVLKLWSRMGEIWNEFNRV